MRSRVLLFAAATLGGGLLGYAWNWPVFNGLYKGFIRALRGRERAAGQRVGRDPARLRHQNETKAR